MGQERSQDTPSCSGHLFFFSQVSIVIYIVITHCGLNEIVKFGLNLVLYNTKDEAACVEETSRDQTPGQIFVWKAREMISFNERSVEKPVQWIQQYLHVQNSCETTAKNLPQTKPRYSAFHKCPSVQYKFRPQLRRPFQDMLDGWKYAEILH